MRDSSDMDLVRRYAQHHDDAAFAELVQRHVNLVYSVALRYVANGAQAEEITQVVFVTLARKGGGLRPDTVLAAWLYETARLTAISFLRGERRRQFREQEAYMQSTLESAPTDSAWQQLAPLLDDAMMWLGHKDREAVVLRFFKDKDLREVAAALNINEAAAQKRIHRAVEKLRMFFAKRGVAVGASGLVAALSANAVQAAPAGLAVTISTAAAMAGTTLAATATATATKAIAMTTLQKTVITATLVAAVGTGVYEAHQASTLRTQVQALQQQQAPLTEQLQQLTGINSNLSDKLAMADKNAANKSFKWESLESSDYKQYIVNLRAIGCPEQTIRDIIVTDVDRTYWQRMAKARPSGGRNYWEARIPQSVWNKKNAEYASLQVEKWNVMSELLGIDARAEELRRDGQPAPYEDGFEFLPTEKQKRLREIDLESSTMEIANAAKKGKDRSREIREWKDAAIKNLLTPEELNEYEMRWSGHGSGLAQMARAFEPSEQEFRTIFQTEKQFGRDDYGWVEGTTGYAQRKPADAEAEQRFQSALQQALGAERYAEYQRSLDPNYLILYDIARNDGLPKDTILKAYELNRAAEQQAAAFRSDVSLLGEARQAALRQLEEQTDKDIAKLLGNGVLKRFRSGQRDAALYPAKPGR